MNTKHSHSRIWGALMAFSLLCGIIMVSSTSAQAQWTRDRRDDRYEQERRDRERERRRREERYRRNRGYDNNGVYGNNGGYGGYGGYGRNNVYQIAQDQGYQAGLNTGASDAERGQSYDPQRSHYYKSATDGYNSSYGNKDAYKQAYRNAFVQGYREGFQRYGGYNNGRNYPGRRSTGSILGDIFGRP
jgi:hypothetical protein